MDAIYAQSQVILALKDTLCNLAHENFITKTSADAIFSLSCKVLRRQIVQNPSLYTNVTIQGQLQLYRFRKNIWTLCVDKGDLLFEVPQLCEKNQNGDCLEYSYHIILKSPVKIIALDKRFWISK